MRQGPMAWTRSGSRPANASATPVTVEETGSCERSSPVSWTVLVEMTRDREAQYVWHPDETSSPTARRQATSLWRVRRGVANVLLPGWEISDGERVVQH